MCNSSQKAIVRKFMLDRLISKTCFFVLGLASVIDAAEPLVLPPKPLVLLAGPHLHHAELRSSSLTWFDRVHAPVVGFNNHLQSSASCAATACHGGPRPGRAEKLVTHGAEYPLWLENDPHAQSWKTITSAASIQMMERLKIVSDGKILDASALENCLACHNTTRDSRLLESAICNSQSQVDADCESLREGVGCASCHGPADGWRSDHYRIRRDDISSANVGFVPNKNLIARARMCATCHIGDQDRDMNHDIIAAGHPALHYEFASYHAMMPKHWRDAAANNEQFGAQLWLAGQIAALDASLVLLESRASKKLSVSTWPEFAASDCSNCHQSIRTLETERTTLDATTKSFGGFGTWNRFGVDLILASSAVSDDKTGSELASSLQSILKLTSTAPIPDRALTSQAAVKARNDLDNWLQHSVQPQFSKYQTDDLRSLLVSEMQSDQRYAVRNWESMAQFYLAVLATKNEWQSASGVKDIAHELRKSLLFKPGSSSLALRDDKDTALKIDRLTRELANRLRIEYHIPSGPQLSPSTRP